MACLRLQKYLAWVLRTFLAIRCAVGLNLVVTHRVRMFLGDVHLSM
jgi:hypothetical protein